jgi:hypothetical protein
MSDWRYDSEQVDGLKQMQEAVRKWSGQGWEVVQILELREAHESFLVLVRRPAET